VVALWPYRRELTVAWVVWWLWGQVGGIVPGWWSLLVTLALTGALLIIRPVRRWLQGWLGAGRTRRRLLTAFEQTRSTNVDGRVPRVVRVRSTRIGERLWLKLRPGQSFELLDLRTDEFRAALRCRDVRLTRDRSHADRVTVDVVRRDTLTGNPVPWADVDLDVLSIWDPVHWGVSELGDPVRLSLVERVVLIGGNRGAGNRPA